MPVRTAGGFTLLEVLLVLVLIGGATVLFVLNADKVIEPRPMAELEKAFQRAQSEGRWRAVEDRKTYRLVWDKEGQRFVLLDRAVVSNYPIEGLEGKPSKMNATFFYQVPLTKGASFQDSSWYQADSINLFPNATSPPFKVRLEAGSRQLELEVEPFTGFITKRSG